MKDCSTCVYSFLEVVQDPCFKCLETPYKKYYERILDDKSEIRKMISEYKILSNIFANSTDLNEINKTHFDMRNVFKKLSNEILTGVLNGDIILSRIGANGKHKLI